jgi:O-succinylbenzoate synthase
LTAIERIELSVFKLKYRFFFETSFGREEGRTGIIVRAFSGGLCGYGEVVASQRPLYSYETTATARLILADLLIPLVFKEGILEPEDFAARARVYKGHPMAKAGLELALWDLKAKRAGVPLSELYGGVRDEVASGVSVGIQDTPDQLLRRIENFLAEGYPRVKIKIKPGWDVDICRAIRERWPGLSLQVDANAAYSLEDAPLLRGLDEFDLNMLEQPFTGEDLWDHARLQKEMSTPICLDESAKSASAVRQAVELGSGRIFNIKVGRVGGIVEARRIHDFCREHKAPVWCGGMLETGVGRAHNLHLAALPGFTMANDISASRRYFDRDLIDPEVELTARGTIAVPRGPGIGVTPDEERIRRACLKHEIFSV